MTNTYNISDFSTASPSLAVVEAIAEEDGVEPTALTPLGECVDVDVIDRTVENDALGGKIEFEYEGHSIIVRANGVILVD